MSQINNLPDHTQAERDKKADLKNRAIKVGLDGTATEKDVVKAEVEKGVEKGVNVKINDLPITTQVQRDIKDKLDGRASAVGLDGNSTEDQVVKAEEKKRKQ